MAPLGGPCAFLGINIFQTSAYSLSIFVFCLLSLFHFLSPSLSPRPQHFRADFGFFPY